MSKSLKVEESKSLIMKIALFPLFDFRPLDLSTLSYPGKLPLAWDPCKFVGAGRFVGKGYREFLSSLRSNPASVPWQTWPWTCWREYPRLSINHQSHHRAHFILFYPSCSWYFCLSWYMSWPASKHLIWVCLPRICWVPIYLVRITLFRYFGSATSWLYTLPLSDKFFHDVG